MRFWAGRAGAHAGRTEEGADDVAIIKVEMAIIGAVDWAEQGRARVMGVNKGLLRVYGERNTAASSGRR